MSVESFSQEIFYFCKIHSESLNDYGLGHASVVKPCKVVLEDVLCKDKTKMFKLLDKNPDELHSVDPQLSEEGHLLESFAVKEPIAWPSASSKDWDTLDAAVYSRIVGVPSIKRKVEVLEELMAS